MEQQQQQQQQQHYSSNHSKTLELPPSSSTTTTTTTSSSNNSSPFKTEINARHYKLILEEDSEQVPDPSDLRRTSDKSTILHILASMPNTEQKISYIVPNCPKLLTEGDSRGDLPLHIAVRAGHETVVHKLVEMGDGSMLEVKNSEDNIALHIALENQQKGMAEYLFEKCQHVINCKNTKGISPLYLAIKAGFWDLVMKMIDATDFNNNDASISRVFMDDECIRYSVFHALIMAKNKGALEKIIQKKSKELQHSMDESGRRPLSYAAFTGFLEGVKSLIINDYQNNSNSYLAFKLDKDGSFPIHAACQGGHIRVVEEMFSKLPEKMRWLLNQKGQNILHVAAQFGNHAVVEYILTHPSRNLGTMINMKDVDGYTPLHLGALGKNPRVVYDLTLDKRTKLNLQCKRGFTALDIAEHFADAPSFKERLTWLALVCAGVQRAPLPQQNNGQERDHFYNGLELHGKTTLFTDQHGAVKKVTNHPTIKNQKVKYKERLNTLLIISTLVATVTYASGFTVPGGYNNSSPGVGLATLDHKFAFQVFVISSSMAMYTSVLALVALIWAHLEDLRLVLVSLDVALPLLGTALVTMSVALMSGLYVVLEDLVWLRVVVLVMGGVFLGLLLLLFLPLYSPTSCIRFRLSRYVFHVSFKLMLLAC